MDTYAKQIRPQRVHGAPCACVSVRCFVLARASDYVVHVQSDLVLVNVTVRDKSGKFVQGLKPKDFTILEDNKPQKVISFDVENVDAVPGLDVAQAKPLPGPAAGQPVPPATSAADAAAQFKDRRLIVLFFDLSAMEPDEIDHAVTSAEHYVDTQMGPRTWCRLFHWEARCW